MVVIKNGKKTTNITLSLNMVRFFGKFVPAKAKADMNEKGIVINKIVYLNVSEEEVIRRLTARGRADDKPEVIKHRIELYQKETGPVIEHYRDHAGFIEIKAEGAEPEEIAKQIINKVKNK